MLYWLAKFTVGFFLKLFFRVELEGQEVFPSKSTFILASNHPSYFDPPLLAAVLRRRIYFLAKEELFRNWFCRAFFHQLGAIPLKRRANDIQAMRMALKILKEKPILIFPQGVSGASLDTVNYGVGFLAKKSGVPVIAARIYGLHNFFSRGKSLIAPKKIKVVFSQVDTIGPQDTNEAIAGRVMDTIKSL